MTRILASFLFCLTGVLFCMSSATMAADLTLPPCPKSPNCVSSQASDESHHVAPLPGRDSITASAQALTKVLDSLPRVKWQQPADNHITATFTSLIFRFVDDVEFIIRDHGKIDVRSASRVGYSDLGANRRRVEHLRELLEADSTAQ